MIDIGGACNFFHIVASLSETEKCEKINSTFFGLLSLIPVYSAQCASSQKAIANAQIWK